MRPGLLFACLGLALAAAICSSSFPALARAASPYPAGATRPKVIAKPSEYARPASVKPSGGISPVGATPKQSHSKPPPQDKASTTGSAKSKSKAKRKVKPKPKPKPTLHGNPARALVAFEAMQKDYYIEGKGLYSGEPYSFLWPFSQAFAATVTMNAMPSIAKVPGLTTVLSRQLNARLVGLRNYFDTDNSGEPQGVFTSALPAYDGTVAPPTGPGGAKYYDDNEWVGLELVRVYKLTHNTAALESAEQIMAFVMAGWQTKAANGEPEQCPGGIPFSNAAENRERNTVTDGPAAELGVDLYRVTANDQYLQFGLEAYEWTRTCLLQPSGLFADHIYPNGAIEQNLWSYNQGSMIGAGTMLYQATGNSGYLYQARQLATASLKHFTLATLNSELPFFVSVYFRNLLYLDSVTHDPPGPKLAQEYVNYAWQNRRLSNNIFVAGTPLSGQLLVQAAIVQIYALLSSSPSTYF